MQLTDKPWCWSETYGPQAECDNVLTFTMTGVTDEGNTSGICINDAGADGKYADFIFLGDGNKENPGVDIDLKKFYRLGCYLAYLSAGNTFCWCLCVILC